MKWDSKANITIGFVLALCSCLAIAVLAYRSTNRLISASRLVVHTDEVLQELQITLEQVTRLDSTQRGFILTADERYLQNHDAVVQEMYQHLRQLRQMTSDNLRQQPRLKKLEEIIADKVAWQSRVAAVLKQDGKQSASDLVATGTGQRLTEAIRDLLAEMTFEEQQLLRQRTDVARTSAAATLRIIAAFGLATAFFLSFAYYLIMRDLRTRESVQSQLELVQEQLRHSLHTEQELARIDPLTSLPNRRAFFEAAESEAARAGRFSQPLTVAYLDVDNLKEVNDEYGHDAGDAVLKWVAQTLRDCLRAVDSSARLGGDEFAVLLPNTDFVAAKSALSKLHQRLLESAKQKSSVVTFSVGAAVFHPPIPTCSHMLTAADKIMYSVKSRGKNAVQVQIESSSIDESADSASA